MAKAVIDRSMQSLGGLGLCQDTPLAHMWANARVTAIILLYLWRRHVHVFIVARLLFNFDWFESPTDFMNVQVLQLADGPDEVHMASLAKHEIGNPCEPRPDRQPAAAPVHSWNQSEIQISQNWMRDELKGIYGYVSCKGRVKWLLLPLH